MGRLRFAVVVLIAFSSGTLRAQDVTVSGRVNIIHRSKGEHGSGDVVVSLTSAQGTEPVLPGPTLRFVQKNKRFTPHLLAVTRVPKSSFPTRILLP